MPSIKSVLLGARLLELLQDLHDRRMFPFVEETASKAALYAVDKFSLQVGEGNTGSGVIRLDSHYLESKKLELTDWTLSQDQELIIRGYYQQHKIHEFNIESKASGQAKRAQPQETGAGGEDTEM